MSGIPCDFGSGSLVFRCFLVRPMHTQWGTSSIRFVAVLAPLRLSGAPVPLLPPCSLRVGPALSARMAAAELFTRVSPEEHQATKKRVTDKIIAHLKEFLKEPGIFERDVYDALQDTYSTPELRQVIAMQIDVVQKYLADSFGLGPAPAVLQVRVCTDRMSVLV